jgi:Ni/Co efflux regulator RcnB
MKPIRTILLIVGILVAGIAANTAVAGPLPYEMENRIDSDHGRHKCKDKHKDKVKHEGQHHKHGVSQGKEHKDALKQKGK